MEGACAGGGLKEATSREVSCAGVTAFFCPLTSQRFLNNTATYSSPSPNPMSVSAGTFTGAGRGSPYTKPLIAGRAVSS